MAPILASRDVLVGHMALKINSSHSLGYELPLGTSLAKVSRDDCKVFMCERKVSDLIYYFFVIIVVISVILLIVINNQDKHHRIPKSDP